MRGAYLILCFGTPVDRTTTQHKLWVLQGLYAGFCVAADVGEMVELLLTSVLRSAMSRNSPSTLRIWDSMWLITPLTLRSKRNRRS